VLRGSGVEEAEATERLQPLRFVGSEWAAHRRLASREEIDRGEGRRPSLLRDATRPLARWLAR
jgi:hypothetical protein